MSEFGLILCEMCGSIQDESNTEDFFENHGHNGSERLSRTTCCKASYTDVDDAAMADELMRIRDWKSTDGVHTVVMSLPQIWRDNIDIIIAKKFDL